MSRYQPIPNILADFPDCNCFACSPTHEWGFRLRFFHDTDTGEVVSTLDAAKEAMAGFPGVLHGGFQTMLLDEVMFWAALHASERFVVTGSLNVRFRRAVRTGQPIECRARADKVGARVVACSGRLLQNGREVAGGEGKFVTPDEKTFRESLGLDEVPESFRRYLR
ncbi:PaaI family thioesterase [Desulfohalovibrio reitneri]|uniref:PaaI family thioesterase n=1 Tax=Desulfohalovibrio reitneri TaxID=1307759 RepID=UPI000690FC90|nr:PaaI family thioesterase [Desulfohalovibrio reitneri]